MIGAVERLLKRIAIISPSGDNSIIGRRDSKCVFSSPSYLKRAQYLDNKLKYSRFLSLSKIAALKPSTTFESPPDVEFYKQ